MDEQVQRSTGDKFSTIKPLYEDGAGRRKTKSSIFPYPPLNSSTVRSYGGTDDTLFNGILKPDSVMPSTGMGCNE